MADKWLEARLTIEKAGVAPPPPPTPAKPSDYLLDELFGSEAVLPVEKTAQIFDDGSMEIADPVQAFVSKLMRGAAGVPEIAPPEEPHKDGTVVEKSVGGTFHYTYKNGRLTKTEIFSSNGGHEVINETAEPVYIPTQLAKVIGVDSDSMHNDLGLAGFVPDLGKA
jgi:hypothetical protein